MLLAIQSEESLTKLALPRQIGGAHWVHDAEGQLIASIESRDDSWMLFSQPGYSIVSPNRSEHSSATINQNRTSIVNLIDRSGNSWSICGYPECSGDRLFRTYGFSDFFRLTIGRNSDNALMYGNALVSSHHALLVFQDNSWSITDLDSSNGTFVNGRRLRTGESRSLAFGDTVCILGLVLTVGMKLFSCNNPSNETCLSSASNLVLYEHQSDLKPDHNQSDRVELFYPALRFARSVEEKSFEIDAPPQPAPEDEQSLAMKIGPSLIMGICALVSASVFASMMATSNASILRSVPMVGMAVGMLTGSVLWPIINARNAKKKHTQKEAKRRSTYSQYVSKTLSEIAKSEATQAEILRENRIPVTDCIMRAVKLDDSLMDRGSMHKDYLELRIGLGNEPFKGTIRFPQDRFSLEDDDLRKAVLAQADKPRILCDVPLALPLLERNIVGIVGNEADSAAFARGLIVQASSLFSYRDVKIVILCDAKTRSDWSFASYLPHCFSDDKKIRFFASNSEETNSLEMFLERAIGTRCQEANYDARKALPYFIVLCTSESISDKSQLVKTISSFSCNLGVSLISIAKSMKDLPVECRWVMGVDKNDGFILDRDVASGEKRTFKPDIFVSKKESNLFARCMGRVHLDIKIQDSLIPDSLGFFEMLNVSNVNHINIRSRWRQSNAAATLACRVGIDTQGDPFVLNIHENAHGPHGLIAGTTGSGKSQFLVTYILSMALNYPPDEVSFVLIDYKGGGLAKAFDNDRIRLPHVAGVITNLDGSSISRSLASIKSELERRQKLFNEARTAANGENVDIYSYLNLYKQGRVSRPCPHLIIVADEFAELKAKEPDFMDELISAARIGRSLGIHLVLATQKPSGVVDDQIWSNARFKICLKVADANDSNEMIKRPDAAELKQAGRFYLLVGHNEYFALGQSAYAGNFYSPDNEKGLKSDNAITLISDTGTPLLSISSEVDGKKGQEISEINVLLEEISLVASTLGIRAKQLWLNALESIITVDSLKNKYRGGAQDDIGFRLDPIVGEFDDPAHQRQGLVTLPFSSEGKALVYGTSDSGIETILYALLYSLITNYQADEVNAYVLDFGSESLRAFQDAPQVGDVIGISECEKISRFFASMEVEYARRRKLLAPYGGSYERYRESSPQGELAAMVIALNDAAAFLDTFPRMEDDLAKLIRESGRNGIYLVMTAANSSSIRLRMRQAFRSVLACNIPEKTEYANIFGSMQGVPTPKGYARGLVRLDNDIFEFQGAHISDGGNEYGFAVDVCAWEAREAQASQLPFAPSIPIAPERVTPRMLADLSKEEGRYAIGFYDDNLQPAFLDFSDTPLIRCLYQKKKDGTAFLRSIMQSFSESHLEDVALIDIARLYGETQPKSCCFSTRQADCAISYLRSIAESYGNSYGDISSRKPVLLVVCGIAELLNKAGFDNAAAMKTFLRNLGRGNGAHVLLVDSAVDCTYTFEDWYKTHLTNKDGLWIGAGIDSQNAMPINFSASIRPDKLMSSRKGYESSGGTIRLVHLVSLDED